MIYIGTIKAAPEDAAYQWAVTIVDGNRGTCTFALPRDTPGQKFEGQKLMVRVTNFDDQFAYPVNAPDRKEPVPGPWFFSEEEYLHTRELHIYSGDEKPVQIATVDLYDHDLDHGPATARCMAASLEMRDALRELLAIEGAAPRSDATDEYMTAIRKARKALFAAIEPQ